MHPYLTILAALVGGTLSVLMALLAMKWLDRRVRTGYTRLLDDDLIAPCIMLFRNGRLVDATVPARNILDYCPPGDLAALKGWLSGRFDDLSALDALATHGGRVELRGSGNAGTTRMHLCAEEVDQGVLRLTLILPGADATGMVVDSLSQQAMEEELSLLRGIVDAAPMMITRQEPDGKITWANAAYFRASEDGSGVAVSASCAVWPLTDILIPDPAPGPDGISHRARIEQAEKTRWFDCYEHRDDGGVTTYALPADTEVQAEQSLREFLQILTKTFADLPTGLAIFDRDRQLQLFNPALIDLTGLATGFLTTRPSLYSVLDQLRELRMVPEPRDYRSWRKQITTLEAAAAAGHHVETWTLPGGHTYRVTGRPHPGGAIAFLIEDITSEVTLTRRFRAELTLGSQILDGLDQALIVFNAVGQVVMTNRRYVQIWGSVPERMPEALRKWQGEWAEAPGLADLERELGREDPSGQEKGVIFGPGKSGILGWTVSPLPGGKRMVRFTTPAVFPAVDLPETGDPAGKIATA
ncbi:MAG: PAS-domain containing protein [Paracoccus sp. (in: a-proteobacteria)]